MKMKKQHYDEIKTSLLAMPQAQYTAVYEQNGNKTNIVKFAFDLLCFIQTPEHQGYNYVCKVLYPYLNDSHIETAMVKMIKEISVIRNQQIEGGN